MLKILALDLATTTGWASGVPGMRPLFGHFVMPSTGDDIGKFAAAYDQKLRDLITMESPDIVVFEAPILRGNAKSSISAARKLMGLAWHTEFVCEQRHIRCQEGHLQSVKLHFAGHGHAEKDDMIAVARANGYPVKVSDEADALGLWDLSCSLKYPTLPSMFPLGRMRPADSAKPKKVASK